MYLAPSDMNSLKILGRSTTWYSENILICLKRSGICFPALKLPLFSMYASDMDSAYVALDIHIKRAMNNQLIIGGIVQPIDILYIWRYLKSSNQMKFQSLKSGRGQIVRTQEQKALQMSALKLSRLIKRYLASLPSL